MAKYKRLLHECSEPGCHRIIQGDQRYCDKHAAKHEEEWQARKQVYRRTKLAKMIRQDKAKDYDAKDRDKEAAQFYHSKAWRQVRDYVYSRDGATCQACGNLLDNRKVVDHIHPLKYSPGEKLDTSNLWTLCYKCHYRKTKLEQAIASQPNGIDKLRHLDQDWWTRTLQEQQGKTISMKEWRAQNEQH